MDFFLLRFDVAKPCLALFLNFRFLLKHAPPNIFLCKFYVVCTSQSSKIWWQTSFQTWSTLFAIYPLRLGSKQILLRDKNKFSHKQISNNAVFAFMETMINKNYFAFFTKIGLGYWRKITNYENKRRDPLWLHLSPQCPKNQQQNFNLNQNYSHAKIHIATFNVRTLNRISKLTTILQSTALTITSQGHLTN